MADPSQNQVSELVTLQILWGALLFSVTIYAGLVFLIPFSGPPGPGPQELRTLEIAFAIMSVICLGASYVLSRRLFAGILRDKLGAAASSPNSIAMADLAKLAFTPWVVRMALCEVVAICGFLLAFLSHVPMKIVPFAALSALAMLTAFPSEGSLRRAATG